MKARDIENIRKIEVIAPIILRILAKNPDGFDYNLLFASSFLECVYLTDFLTSSKSIKLASDYKEIESLYKEVISRTSNLTKDFELGNNPIEIFALYVYLYRNGYLSHGKDFYYDMNLKDYPNLLGADVIRGVGVCRSISSMLTDIYAELGYDTTNLAVFSTINGCRKQQKLCDTPLKKNVSTNKFTDLVIKITEKMEIGNHQITLVRDNFHTYILDPTNDGILSYNPEKKILYVTEEENYMKLKKFNQFIMPILAGGNMTPIVESLETDVSLEEYKEIYLRTLKLCKDNIYDIMKFYEANKEIYDDIFKLIEEQKGLIRRIIPIIPKIDIKGAEYLKKLTN